MNFKESYKKANDEIKGDSALLEKILNTPKKEKSKITPFVYKTASLAAAFVLILTVAFMPEIKDKFVDREEKTAEGAVEDYKKKSQDYAEVAAEPEYEATVFSARMTEDFAQEDSIYMATEAYEVHDTDSASTASETEESKIAAYSEDDETLSVAKETSAKESAINEEMKINAYSGGGSSAAKTDEGTDVTVYTAEEVLSQTDINYENLKLDGFLITEDNVSAVFSPEGYLYIYEINITLSCEKKIMNVLLTDSSAPLGYDITEDTDAVRASKTVGGTDIFITAYNMTKDEVENYINSIA